MKHITRKAVTLGVAGSLAGAIAFASQAAAAPSWAGTQAGQPQRTAAASANPAVASAEFAAHLAWMREEERLARDVYTALAERYDGALPFANIARSEQQHFDAVGRLLTRYGVADPSTGRPAGSYAEPELQDLYDTLMAQGEKSLADAYDVGIAIEKADIADLERVLANLSETDVTRVFGNLLRASRQHLAAFEAAKAGEPLGAHDGTGPQARGGAAKGTTTDDRGLGQGRGMARQSAGPRSGAGVGVCVNG